MKVLVIAPHMDDEVLGCGGSIARHVADGDTVHVVVVANRAYGHIYDEALIGREKACCREAQNTLGYQELTFLDLPDERLDAVQIDVIVPLEKVVNEFRPDWVYMPFVGDMNQDHRAVYHAACVACRPFAAVQIQRLLCYEVPSSTDQSPSSLNPFCPNVYVDISETLERKTAAMAAYAAEQHPFPHPRAEKALSAIAVKRGMEAGLEAAEAFMLLREVHK